MGKEIYARYQHPVVRKAKEEVEMALPDTYRGDFVGGAPVELIPCIPTLFSIKQQK